ncbi:CDP-alcohol phosphatidyltransferase family protein [Blastopirellula sp. JC732]|uniref:CDP-alcohol phosphatidyltransferase family protein n=1 Tax=Blastopirellula sediminis TaxID=2894196 RepID=A0A9X1SFW1_9BACT|nr:CDP-alcohol phosphatidyltransferase family protein [Blastopirellula sediminis]MCC9608470.1 CDP-alcohol phosphatidyltransferase family protein [Blastopirellula sediminis]MCC9628753.1 CDP-alcohol phosphatidyltransferase family protein [Blastopirellula sediminis]
MAETASTSPSPAEEPAGRRPLKSRQWPFFQWLAAKLANSGVTPNAISVSSVFAAVLAGICLAATSQVESELLRRGLWLAGAVFIQLRLIANLLDGMVAVEGGKASAVGELFNEVPDRLSDPAILIGAGLAYGGNPIAGMAAALIAVFVAYVRAIGASVGVGQVFLGPFAKQQRMALMTLTCVACALLPDAWQPIHSDTQMGIAAVALLIVCLGGLVTAVRRLSVIANRMRERAANRESVQ